MKSLTINPDVKSEPCCKVLVIEDDPSLIEILCNLFQLAGIAYVIYPDARDIRALVHAHQPDVVLLDYLLPTSNGGHLCQILKMDSSTAAVPVIIYSALSKNLLPINEYACNMFIEKPFNLDDLLKKIQQCAAK